MRIRVDILADVDAMADRFCEFSEDDQKWLLQDWKKANGRFIMPFKDGVKLLTLLNGQEAIIFEVK